MRDQEDLQAVKNPTTYLKEYQPPLFFIPKVVLDFRIGKDKTVVTAQLQVQRNGRHKKTFELHGEKLSLIKVKLGGEELKQFERDEKFLRIETSLDEFDVEIVTELLPHENTELTGLYQSSGNFCTQCEAEGFRRITYFLDRPDVMSEYDVTITADKKQCPVLLSNGNPVACGDNADGTHWHRWHDPFPKPSYLFALVAGDLERISDTFETQSGNEVALHIYTQAHNIDKCDYAMGALKRAMQWDEKVYGREYDLDVFNIVAVDDFNMGAMENKGLNVFNSKFVLADQASATDYDYLGIESVIGHEYFHNWSGNRVTCRDWFQLSLKEGFTVFRDQEFSADMGSRAVKRIRDVQLLREYQFKEDAGPMAHAVRPDSYEEINNFYTVTVYEKGAEVIRMMHGLIGVEGFRKGTDLYFSRFDGQAVTTEDFVQCMEEANEIDLEQFRRWYDQAGTPRLEVQESYSETAKKLDLRLGQSCPATPGQEVKQPFVIPLKMAIFSVDGEVLVDETIVAKEEQQTFSFDNIEKQPVVSLLRDFSAPVILDFEQSDAQLQQLVRFEDNGFSRWEAMQRLALGTMLAAIDDEDNFEQRYSHLAASQKWLLDKQPRDKAILAEMIRLPSASYVGGQCEVIQPLLITSARKRILTQMSADLQAALLRAYKENIESRYSLSGKSMAKRALKNAALNLLLQGEQEEHFELAIKQYEKATNMTDRFAALSALVHSSYDQREALLADFYQQWQHNTLVLDKWFALQASIEEESTLERVKSLSEHPDFSLNNPNKVRALVGAFSANMHCFHQADGESYRWFTDIIIELNGINPNIAARLSGAMNNWKAFAEPHRTLIQEQLQRIIELPDLAVSVREIVSKALNN